MDAGFEVIFGDLMFGLDIPIAIHTLSRLKTLAALLMPIAGRLPFSVDLPHRRKAGKAHAQVWKILCMGNCHCRRLSLHQTLHARRYERQDYRHQHHHRLKMWQYSAKRGVKYLVTTTPVLEGRSFGTNMMEAALVAVSGKGRPLTWPEYN